MSEKDGQVYLTFTFEWDWNATADPVKLDALPINEFLGFFTL